MMIEIENWFSSAQVSAEDEYQEVHRLGKLNLMNSLALLQSVSHLSNTQAFMGIALLNSPDTGTCRLHQDSTTTQALYQHVGFP